ncbi:MAG: phage tail protein [Stenomitos frigidus ULC029]
MATPLPSQFRALEDSQGASFVLRTMATQFGDGYIQRSPDGLNALKEIPKNIAFICVPGTNTSLDTLTAFLVARKGTEPIILTVPGDTAAKQFLCTSWEHTSLGAGLFRVTLQLELVYL